MNKLRGVAVGTGYFSQFQYEAWERIDNVEIVAVSSRRIEKAQKICDTYGIKKAYGDFEQMLKQEKPDFVDIITPPETHANFCRIAIRHGVHIICQKPLAPTYEESLEITNEIKKSNVRMMVHENFRFQPWHREIKKLLNKKTVGDKLHTINLRMRMGDGWQEDAYMNRQPYFREMEKLLIYETGIHFIDVFRYLVGDISQVYAKLRTLNSNIKGEDFAWVQVEFSNGTLGFIDANRFNENTSEDPRLTFGEILIEGDKGSIRLYHDGVITIQLLGEKEVKHDYVYEKINFAGDCVYFTQEHFIDCLRSGAAFETDVFAYLQNIKVQDKIYESNSIGAQVTI
ncbi:Gfo/Idh/MocA family oxidoreductase [uncultured Maribacter sp.]|uniref:Gfo/Idh/MocA family protein n=1 Tax=uncultured Maribacter sp. TaxID=431308 RepID=UPI00260DEB71|nr:Gfo/Idh/MocA family oxidoreductase [uncultured Maribacter sp.]